MGLRTCYKAKCAAPIPDLPTIGPVETSMKTVSVFDPCGDHLDSLTSCITDDINLCVDTAVTFSNETADMQLKSPYDMLHDAVCLALNHSHAYVIL